MATMHIFPQKTVNVAILRQIGLPRLFLVVVIVFFESLAIVGIHWVESFASVKLKTTYVDCSQIVYLSRLRLFDVHSPIGSSFH